MARNIEELPEEIKQLLFRSIVDNDVYTSGKNIENLFKSAPGFSHILNDPLTAKFREHRKALTSIQRKIYDLVVPVDGFYESSYDQPSAAYTHVAIAASTLSSRPPEDRAELFFKVRDISNQDGVRNQASIPLVASPHIPRQYRDKLIEELTESYTRKRRGGDPEILESLSKTALYGLIHAKENGGLTQEQERHLPEGTLSLAKPDCFPDRNYEQTQHFRDEHKSLFEHISSHSNLDSKIHQMRIILDDLAGQLPPLERIRRSILEARDRKFEVLGIVSKLAEKLQANNARLFIEGDHREELIAGDSHIVPTRAPLDQRDRSRSSRGD